MGALRKPAYQPQEAEIIIFPFEQARPQAPNHRAFANGVQRFQSSEFYDVMMFELKAFGVTAFLGAMLFASFVGGMKSKEAAGLDLNPNSSYSAMVSDVGAQAF